MGDTMATDGSRIRVLTADDHPVVRAGIAAMIANEPDIDIVAEGRDGTEAVALFEVHRPDVVLIDLRMPKLDGVGAIRAIRDIDPNARIIALTTYDGDADIHRAPECRGVSLPAQGRDGRRARCGHPYGVCRKACDPA